MSKSRLRRPSPALIIASIALFMALGGGAYAATSSDSKQDKKIASAAAKNYFKKHIGSASVSHANTANSSNTANSANSANTANTAGSAGTASNALALGGVAPSGYAQTAQPSFIAPTLNSGYSNFGSGFTPAGYEKDTLGFVHLQGVLNCPTGVNVAFTLPAGYRPSTNVVTTEANNTGVDWLDVFSNGEVETASADGICAFSISFPAAGVAGTSTHAAPAASLSRRGAVR
jgi:hypothetical protein